jgi:hypothetical protein
MISFSFNLLTGKSRLSFQFQNIKKLAYPDPGLEYITLFIIFNNYHYRLLVVIVYI